MTYDETKDETKIEDAVLALLAACSFDGYRAWKGFDFHVLDQLHAKGLIDDPKGKTKSVWLTPDGLERGNAIADRLFGNPQDG